VRSIDAITTLASALPSYPLVVAGVGRAAYCAVTTWPGRVLAIDALGDVLPVALGVSMAIAKSHASRTVLSLEGDGSFLFGLAGLATMAATVRSLDSFIAVIIDNGKLESGGGSPSRTFPLDIASLVRSFHLAYSEASELEAIPPALRAVEPIGVLRMVVGDTDALPVPSHPENGREAVFAFRSLLAAETGVPLTISAAKY
jgi:thiamine pyrophosphate-dependent acetolactate synthase large subunit-like protein